jgi:hypothetical protein
MKSPPSEGEYNAEKGENRVGEPVYYAVLPDSLFS